MKDSKDIAKYIVEMTRHWFEKYAGYSSLSDAQAVIGISGGKDSSVVAALCAKAIGANSVFGVIMPNGKQDDINDAWDLCDHLKIRRNDVNIFDAYSSIRQQVDDRFIKAGPECGHAVATNLPARLRMATLYAVAQSINGRVIGTGNRSESLASFFTLWGDSACDFNPIKNLWVEEVISVGEALGLPERFTRKPPSDGMCGKTDEEALGFSYSELRRVYLGDDTVAPEKQALIKKRIAGSEFKRRLVSGVPGPDDIK